jgi:hypothetical protein
VRRRRRLAAQLLHEFDERPIFRRILFPRPDHPALLVIERMRESFTRIDFGAGGWKVARTR